MSTSRRALTFGSRANEGPRLEDSAQGPERGEPWICTRSSGATDGQSAQDLEAAAASSTAEGDKTGSGVRWIRSYVLEEESGELGTVCIYEAESPEAIRAHADAAGLPVDEIIPVADTVIVRPDPTPVEA